MLCRICVAQIQPKKHVLDRVDYTAPTRQHELDHTDQKPISPERSIDHQAGVDFLSDVCILLRCTSAVLSVRSSGVALVQTGRKAAYK